MKRTRNIAQHPFGLILTLVGLMSVVTFVLEPVALAVSPRWIPTGNLNIPRSDHTATLLANGKILVAAGSSGTGNTFNILNSAELYDPTDGTWSVTVNLNKPRYLHIATLLPTGKILVAGGNCETENNTNPIIDKPAPQSFEPNARQPRATVCANPLPLHLSP